MGAQRQRQESARPASPAPWSPFTVSVITLLLPAGGAVLTVWNLRRLDQLDRESALRLGGAVLLVFALGTTALLVISGTRTQPNPQIGADASTVISIGVAVASYVVLRAPFRTWRSRARARPDSWLRAVGYAFVFTVLWALGVVPLYLLTVAALSLASAGT